jgi:hypothetical protein
LLIAQPSGLFWFDSSSTCLNSIQAGGLAFIIDGSRLRPFFRRGQDLSSPKIVQNGSAIYRLLIGWQVAIFSCPIAYGAHCPGRSETGDGNSATKSSRSIVLLHHFGRIPSVHFAGGICIKHL